MQKILKNIIWITVFISFLLGISSIVVLNNSLDMIKVLCIILLLFEINIDCLIVLYINKS